MLLVGNAKEKIARRNPCDRGCHTIKRQSEIPRNETKRRGEKLKLKLPFFLINYKL